jgi:hypothetical protein
MIIRGQPYAVLFVVDGMKGDSNGKYAICP